MGCLDLGLPVATADARGLGVSGLGRKELNYRLLAQDAVGVLDKLKIKQAVVVGWSDGELFYNFQGLRRYKGKFNPQWRPRYLASRGGTQLSAELLAVTMLISGSSRKNIQ
ncbi:MAG: hypothetical protein DRP64_01095 [Verrucomicrobia bacterium]|nr:MAG: hypothetical protein DRP64_01095 [Verrucomicrobiota bacterium]